MSRNSDGPSPLTMAFLSKRPEAAAHVLESLSIDAASAFVETLAPSYASTLLGAVSATSAAAIAQSLPSATVTVVLRDMELASASAVLRRMSNEKRLPILTGLPDGRRRQFEKAIKFAGDSVGAHMSSAVVTASKSDSVVDALKRVRDDRDGQSSVVFVIDEQRKWLGSIRLAVLARRRSGTPLVDLLDKSGEPLAARAPLSQVSTLAAWRHHTELPVVSGQGELIGLLYRHVAAGSKVVTRDGGGDDGPSMAESVLHRMAQTTGDLLGVFVPASTKGGAAGDSNDG